MAWQEIVQRALRNRVDRPLPEPPPLDPSPILPESDAELEVEGGAALAHDHISALVAIRYVDASKAASRRRITISSIYERGSGDVYVRAYCHERLAPRVFVGSRITELTDLSTGEIFSDALAFLRQHIAFTGGAGEPRRDDTQRAIARCRRDLAILTFFARCDDEFVPAERRAIREHVARRCPGVAFDERKVSAYVGRLFPDRLSFLGAVGDLLSASADEIAVLIEGIEAVINADGRVAEEEVRALGDLRAALEPLGIKLSYGAG